MANITKIKIYSVSNAFKFGSPNFKVNVSASLVYKRKRELQ